MVTYHKTQNIRALLIEGFSDEELRHLCFDVPDFRPVYERLSPSVGKDQVIQELIEYAERRELTETLLALAKTQNPVKYEKYQPYYDNGRKFPRNNKFYFGLLAVTLIIGIGVGGLGVFVFAPSTPQTGTSDLIVASSTFDKDADGWTIEGGGSGPSYKISGGASSGYIFSRDNSGELPDWFWKAPPKFLGNHLDAYGGVLFFALTQDNTEDQYTTSDDVVLVGENITLTLDLNNPGRAWTEYAVWLHELGRWKKEKGNAPTQGEMQKVLSSLNELKIRGEYHSGDDTGGLDNVVLLRHP